MKNLSKCQEVMTIRKLTYLDSSYHKNKYKHIGIDSSWQKTTIIPQKVNFTVKINEHDGEAMFCIADKQQKAVLNFV